MEITMRERSVATGVVVVASAVRLACAARVGGAVRVPGARAAWRGGPTTVGVTAVAPAANLGVIPLKRRYMSKQIHSTVYEGPRLLKAPV